MEEERAEAFFPLQATTTAADSERQDRVPLSWTNERADTLFVCE